MYYNRRKIIHYAFIHANILFPVIKFLQKNAQITYYEKKDLVDTMYHSQLYNILLLIHSSIEWICTCSEYVINGQD